MIPDFLVRGHKQIEAFLLGCFKQSTVRKPLPSALDRCNHLMT